MYSLVARSWQVPSGPSVINVTPSPCGSPAMMPKNSQVNWIVKRRSGSLSWIAIGSVLAL
jgi:hypothetical protein